MPRQIFVTGASGFIGKNIVERLTATTDYHIKTLTRAESTARASTDRPIEQVVGDLLKPETYRAALKGCDVVVHLAAATGRMTNNDYQRVNVEGTSALLDACNAT